MSKSKEDLPGQVPGEAVGALNERQEAFCREYIKHLNAKRAYLTAYGCAENSAEVAGCRLLSNHKVLARLAELKAKRNKKLEISSDRVLRELAAIAFANVDDYVEMSPGGSATLKKAPRGKMKGLTSFSYSSSSGQGGESTSFSLRLEKMAAMEKLIKHAGIFEHDAGADSDTGGSADGGILGSLRTMLGGGKKE